MKQTWASHQLVAIFSIIFISTLTSKNLIVGSSFNVRKSLEMFHILSTQLKILNLTIVTLSTIASTTRIHKNSQNNDLRSTLVPLCDVCYTLT